MTDEKLVTAIRNVIALIMMCVAAYHFLGIWAVVFVLGWFIRDHK